MSGKERVITDEKVTWTGLGLNILLTVFKALAGVLGRSSAMVADAGHSVSDIASDIVTITSLKIAKKPIDRDHPYGHGKVEAIAASGLGFILILGGLLILISAIRAMRIGSHNVPGTIALAAAIVSIFIKEVLYRWTAKVGKKINSPLVVANAWHHRSDALSSIAALIGIVGAQLGYAISDLIAAGVVALFIIKVGIDIVIEAFNQLMDKGPAESFLTNVIEIAESVDGVVHCQTRGRRMGRYYLLDVKLDVDPNASVIRGHEIGGTVKQKIIGEVDCIADVMVHINPHDENEHGEKGAY